MVTLNGVVMRSAKMADTKMSGSTATVIAAEGLQFGALLALGSHS